MTFRPVKTRRRPARGGGKKTPGREGRQAGPRPARPEPPAPALQVSPKAARALALIGVPEPAPFVPDEFQLRAVAEIAERDVIVSAPTGSGKTWIAEKAMERELDRGGRCWYASPLKALSNAKFLEFGRLFGPENVGLLTGDHKVNLDAPLIIGTTEILRNQLYDAQSGGGDLACDLVVLDEAHYLGDPERGVVWEEVLIYLPARVRLLMLSATVANADELAAWLSRRGGFKKPVGPERPTERSDSRSSQSRSGRSKNHVFCSVTENNPKEDINNEKKVGVVYGGERPVPLAGLCLQPSGLLTDLASAAGRGAGDRGRRAPFHLQTPNSKVLGALRELDLLPAIFFLKSRADCDAAVGGLGAPPRESRERFETRRKLIDDYLEKYPFLADLPQLGRLRKLAAAAHHAGHLPHFKLMVEDLMSRGLLDVIFATSTVSAGVNFPARTVVIRQSDRFDGQGFSDLTANDFTQMTGRAGRRGRDHIGFVLAVPGPHQDLRLLAGLMNSPPDPVRSGLTINFSMVLNLLNAYRPAQVRRLLSGSLAAWQRAESRAARPNLKNLAASADDLYQDFLRHLEFLRGEGLVDGKGRLTADGQWATELRLDHPLVFYAGLKAGAWPLKPPALAAAVAAITSDKESTKPPPRRRPPAELTGPLTSLILAVNPMMDRLEEAGFAVPDFHLRPAWAVWSWATRGDFDEAVELLGLGAGDLAMLALRTADHLRQTAGVKNQPDLTRAARRAMALIIKEPVSSPLLN